MLDKTEPSESQYSGLITGAKGVTAFTFMIIVAYVAHAVQSGDWTMDEAVQNAFAILITAALPTIYTTIKNFVREALGWNVWKALF